MAHRNFHAGTVIPIPVETEKQPNVRESHGILWGMVQKKPKPFLMNTKRGEVCKVYLIVRFGRKKFQRCPVTSDNPWFDMVVALEPDDVVLICGKYQETDYIGKDGQEYTNRDFFPGFICPVEAVVNPARWQARLDAAPDPFYLAKLAQEEKEKKKKGKSDDDEEEEDEWGGSDDEYPDFSDGQIVHFKPYY